MKIACLITVFNRKKETLRCLKNLHDQSGLKNSVNLDVFLVDDGCTDGTPNAVRTQFPDVNIIRGDGNLFWNRGMNLAWRKANATKTYDYFLWLNDDTELNDNALSELLRHAHENGSETIIVGTTSSFDHPKDLTYGGRRKNSKIIHPKEQDRVCSYFNGNVVLIPKAAFEKVGYNDPVFKHALGDFDYGRRANKLGIKSIVADSILGRCDRHSSYPVWCDPKKPFKQRWASFRTPLGQNPEEFFVYEKRHNGLFIACLHYITNHLRVFFPKFWN